MPTIAPRIVLTDPTLFGNDAAEDEREEIFYSYAFERPELTAFADPKRALCIAHAYKGEGKTALLRLTRRRLENANPQPIAVSKTANELAPEVPGADYHTWTRAWKGAILSVFAAEIGSRIGVAWSDDAMSLVEEAEKTGFKKRSLLSSILDRLKLPEVELPGGKLALPERRILGTINPTQAVKRFVQGKHQLWLFVDDVDKNFENTKTYLTKIASFFDASRELVNSIPELRVRTAIRPNVFTATRLFFESMSHVQQYIHSLEWDEEDIRRLLGLRVESYLKRTQQTAALWAIGGRQEQRDRKLIALVFEDPMPWGGQGRTRPPHVVLHTLSKHRPRWVIELAKVGSARAVKRGGIRINLGDLVKELPSFGARRIQDTVAEFRAQSETIEEMIAAFNREAEQFTTDELLKVIDNKILSHVDIRIVGINARPTNLQVAAFLFEVGLFYGRRDHPDGTYEHVGYSERPSLLKARTSIDDGLTWEIHPVFRQALEMRDDIGQEVRRR